MKDALQPWETEQFVQEYGLATRARVDQMSDFAYETSVRTMVRAAVESALDAAAKLAVEEEMPALAERIQNLAFRP